MVAWKQLLLGSFEISKRGKITASSDNGEKSGLSSQARSSHTSVGFISATFLIVNRIIGTGIFATPSTIINETGSPGLALIMWVVGALVAFSGLMVYLEFGSQIPKNGAEKNYLEYFYTRPRFLCLCSYSATVLLMGGSASNSTAFGSYILAAAGKEVTKWNQRLVGFACLTFACLMSALLPHWSLRLQNLLGTFKVVVLLLIIVIGWVGWAGGGGIEKTHNFDHSFQGDATANGVVSALYNIMFSYSGYATANYVLGESKDPQRILKYAAPSALIILTILYMLANVSYLGVVPLARMKNSGVILAADFFDIVWGPTGRKALSVFVALSALGNVMSSVTGQARLIQELGRASVLPFSKLWATSWPFHTPAFAVLEHYAMCLIILFAVPAGPAYSIILNVVSYPGSVMGAGLGLALSVIHLRKKHYPDWNPPIKGWFIAAFFFFLSNLYLVAAPFVPPAKGKVNQYNNEAPYWIHCVIGFGLFGIGGLYWLFAFILWPKLRGYEIDTVPYLDRDGWEQERIVHYARKDGKRGVLQFSSVYDEKERQESVASAYGSDGPAENKITNVTLKPVDNWEED